MSPRTKLFVQEGSIDHLYDSSLVRIISKSQEEEIRKKKPRKELVGIWYLKNVFLAFVIDDANHYSLDLSYLVRIIDSTKFNSVYNNFKCYSELSAIDKKSSNWIYPVDEQWSICTGDLVHNGSDSICFYLKSR
ncbi:MAG: hypothetical protein EP305_04250 [Bacteroidetes bacterium]|nr:MAG: hypothetical protein EP305_04250 [Bacteroidota bacterium]